MYVLPSKRNNLAAYQIVFAVASVKWTNDFAGTKQWQIQHEYVN